MSELFIGDDDELFGEDEILGDDVDDLFGEDEILGDDEDEILADIFGAAPAKKSRKSRAMMARMRKLRAIKAIAAARAAGGAVSRRKSRRNVYEQPLPIPPTDFTSGQQQDIELRPQRLFRTERLVISSVIAPFFRVLDVKIGQETQFVASGALPATIFSEVAVGVRLKGDTANLGNTIVVSLQNIDAQTRTFSGAIIGTVIM